MFLLSVTVVADTSGCTKLERVLEETVEASNFQGLMRCIVVGERRRPMTPRCQRNTQRRAGTAEADRRCVPTLPSAHCGRISLDLKTITIEGIDEYFQSRYCFYQHRCRCDRQRFRALCGDPGAALAEQADFDTPEALSKGSSIFDALFVSCQATA